MTEKKPFEVKSLGEFLWKTTMYMRYGYMRYALRTIPDGKDSFVVARKLILHYDCTYNYEVRRQRRKKGKANVALLCFEQKLLLLATEGEHREFEKIDSLHFKETALQFSGYYIGVKQQKPRIELTNRRFNTMRKTLQWMALHHHERVTRYMKEISPFSFQGVSDQRWKLIQEVNKTRKKAGLSKIKWDDINPEKRHHNRKRTA